MTNDNYNTQVKWDYIPATQIEVADDILYQLSWAKELIELPEGFFLRFTQIFSGCFSQSFSQIVPYTQVDKHIVDKLLAQQFIERCSEGVLTLQEFEIQRALGLADSMSTYCITAIGRLHMLQPATKKISDVKTWTSTGVDDGQWANKSHWSGKYFSVDPMSSKGMIWKSYISGLA